MVREASAVTRYRFRSNLSHRWGQYGALLGLVAVIGGIAMGSLVAARSTQSAYPAYLRQSDASDLTLSTYGATSASATSYSPATAAAIARLPGVTHVESWIGVFAVPIGRDGAPELALSNEVNLAGSKTGLYFDEDRVTAVQGRVADPRRVDEFMTTALGARLMGMHLGEVVPIGYYTADQAALPGFGTPQVPPARRFEMKLVGIVKFDNEIVEDDADRLPTNVVYTPAFTRLIPDSAANGTWYGIQLAHPAQGIASTERSLLRILPPGASGNFNVTALTEAKVERAVKPESIALAVFGIIAALAGLGIALSIVSRSLQSAEEDRRLLRALGAGPLSTLADALAGPVLAIVIGSLAACGVAVALSGFAPLGPVHSVYHPGTVVDWTVLGVGFAIFAGGLSAAACLIGIRGAPERAARRDRLATSEGSRLAHSATSAGAPLPMVIGLHFSLDPGRGRSAVPPRSVMVGAIVAVAMVTTTLTFGNSLHVLVSQPRLYGWNWTYALMSQNGIPPAALTALTNDRHVEAWSGYGDPDLQVDGQTVPALTTHGEPAVGPPILSGQNASGDHVVLGTATMALLHKHIGDTIYISYGSPSTAPLYLPPTPAVISGTATFPAIAGSTTFAEHTSLGTGLLVTSSDLPRTFLDATQGPDPILNGPGLVFVRMRPGVTPAAARADLQRIVAVANGQFAADPNAAGDTAILLPVQRPAEIVNFTSTGSTPEFLAAALGAAAALALAVALVSTARQRRIDLAVLKTLGFTSRQVAATLIWQATTSVAVGLLIGIPAGIVLGRQLWILFAQNIDVVPAPSVPPSIALVALGALLLAVLVAAIPGRMASTTPAAVVLRQE